MTGPGEQTHFERIAASIIELDKVHDVYGRADTIRNESLEVGQRVEDSLGAADDNIAAAQEEIEGTERQAQRAYRAIGDAVLGLKNAMQTVDDLCTSVDRSRDYLIDAEDNLKTRVKDHEVFVTHANTLNDTAQEGKALADALYTQFSSAGIRVPEAPHAAQVMAAKTAALQEGADSYAVVGEQLKYERTPKPSTKQMSSTAFDLRDMHSQFDTTSDDKLTVRLPLELENALGVLEKGREGIEEIGQRMKAHSQNLQFYRGVVGGLLDTVQDALRILAQNENVPGDLKALATSIKTDAEAYLNDQQ